MSKTNAISRRTMLRGRRRRPSAAASAGFIMIPAAARAQSAAVPRRMFAICNNLGLLPDEFFPASAGPDYAPSNYVKILQDFRKDFTVFSGVSHPNVDGGHPSDISFLTAAARTPPAVHSATPSRSTNTSPSASGFRRAFPRLPWPSTQERAPSPGPATEWRFHQNKAPPASSARCLFRAAPMRSKSRLPNSIRAGLFSTL